jgi:hypothetical protein
MVVAVGTIPRTKRGRSAGAGNVLSAIEAILHGLCVSVNWHFTLTTNW